MRDLLSERKVRRETGCFVVEGAVLIGAALDAGLNVIEEFVLESAEPVSQAVVHWIDETTLERVASTVTPQPNIAVVETPSSPSLGSLTDGWVLVADRVQDPGNLGTMVRSAVAAGASCIVTTPNTVDVLSPKVVRAAAGALFAVSFLQGVSLSAVAENGFELVGTSSHDQPGVVDYDAFDFTRRVALVMGNEAAGLSGDAPVHSWVTIPHAGPVESLNVAMAATVLCFEVARQRGRGASKSPRD